MGGNAAGPATIVQQPDYSNVGKAVGEAFKYPNYQVTGPGGSQIQGFTPGYRQQVAMTANPYLQSNRYGGYIPGMKGTPGFAQLAALMMLKSLPQLAGMMGGGGSMGALGGDFFGGAGGGGMEDLFGMGATPDVWSAGGPT